MQTMQVDSRQYYDLEHYVFETVRGRFLAHGYLSAFDFFCIVIWKSNRAKSKIAKRLLDHGYQTLDEACQALTANLIKQPSPRDRLQYLWETWRLRLPMASAILTVLYPTEFTVYDQRVCDALKSFHNLAGATNFEALWSGYQELLAQV